MVDPNPTSSHLNPETDGLSDLLIASGQLDFGEEEHVAAVGELLTPGFTVETVPLLGKAGALLGYFGLLRELFRHDEAGFLGRFAVLSELASSEKTKWTADELHHTFPWLAAHHRVRVFRSLRVSGWLVWEDGTYALGSAGSTVYTTLASLLGTQPHDGDLTLGVLHAEMAAALGVDPEAPLSHLQHNLRKVISEAEDAMTSHSEVKILDVRHKLDRNLAWSMRARTLLDELDVEDFGAYKTAQAIGRSLSELHQWHGALQRALNDITHRRIHLDASGLSLTDITQFLMKCSVNEIADFGQRFVSQPPAPRFAIVDNVLSEAEYVLYLQEREEEEERRGWTDGQPRMAVESVGEVERFVSLARFVSDVEHLVSAKEERALATFIPHTGWAESAYRLSLLCLSEGGMRHAPNVEDGGDALIAKLRDCPMEFEVTGRGQWIYANEVSEISEGVVRPKQASDHKRGGGA
ncbi:MAG: hypothetical protein HUU55_12430 [Myxococcales bacterium]|nr:hypothetical protein [Myxococcales bacterium]